MTPDQYRALVARANEAAQKRFCGDRIEGDSFTGPSLSKARRELAVLEANLAMRDGAATYNRVAFDVESLRSFVEAELRATRDVLARCEAGLPEVPPIREPTVEACSAFVEASHQRHLTTEAQRAESYASRVRLASAYAAAEKARELLIPIRRRDGLPPPFGFVLADVPATVAQCDAALEKLAEFRRPPKRNGMTTAEVAVRDKRDEVAHLEAREAEMIEDQRRLSEGLRDPMRP